MPRLKDFGITRVARVTGLDRLGIPVWNAARPNAKSLSIHQGKGISDDDARASATMEAVERYVAENISVPKIGASRSALIDRGLRHDTLNSLLGLRQPPLADGEATEWIAAKSLIDGSSVFVPCEAVALNRTHSSRYWQSSDGLASGNTHQEATLHGLLERIERDADTLWSLKRRKERLGTRFAPGDLNDPVVDELAGRMAGAGLRLVLFDMTSDLGVPAVSALIGPIEGGVPRLRYVDAAGGSGAHPVAVRAAIRAITEAAQSRLTLITGARDDVDPARYDEDLSPSLIEDLASPVAKAPPADVPYAADPPSEWVRQIVGGLRPLSERIYAVDLTPDEPDFSVVKVLVPDLEDPEGARRQRYGARALARLTVF